MLSSSYVHASVLPFAFLAVVGGNRSLPSFPLRARSPTADLLGCLILARVTFLGLGAASLASPHQMQHGHGGRGG